MARRTRTGSPWTCFRRPSTRTGAGDSAVPGRGLHREVEESIAKLLPPMPRQATTQHLAGRPRRPDQGAQHGERARSPMPSRPSTWKSRRKTRSSGPSRPQDGRHVPRPLLVRIAGRLCCGPNHVRQRRARRAFRRRWACTTSRSVRPSFTSVSGRQNSGPCRRYAGVRRRLQAHARSAELR